MLPFFALAESAECLHSATLQGGGGGGVVSLQGAVSTPHSSTFAQNKHISEHAGAFSNHTVGVHMPGCLMEGASSIPKALYLMS